MALLWDVDGAIATATIDRPEARNALNAVFCDDFTELLVDLPSAVRVVIVQGTGRAFSSGADLARRAADTGGDGGGIEHGGGDSFRPAFERLGDALDAVAVPVIAAINGHALGAGLQLAVMCDLRVMTDGASIGIPAGKLGVLVSASNIARLVHLVGPAAAREILLTSRAFTPAEAQEMGLVHRVVPDAISAARSWAEEIAVLAPLSVQGHKRAIQLVGAGQSLSEESRAEIAAIEAACFASEDLQEGLVAFNQKRPPQFRGV